MVRIDHSALTYLRKFADQNTRLTRWSFKLTELDFTIEHRPGKKIPRVDALSRHVGTVLHDGRLSPEDFLQEQGKDKYCPRLKLGNYSEDTSSFVTTRDSHTGADPRLNTNYW